MAMRAGVSVLGPDGRPARSRQPAPFPKKLTLVVNHVEPVVRQPQPSGGAAPRPARDARLRLTSRRARWPRRLEPRIGRPRADRRGERPRGDPRVVLRWTDARFADRRTTFGNDRREAGRRLPGSRVEPGKPLSSLTHEDGLPRLTHSPAVPRRSAARRTLGGRRWPQASTGRRALAAVPWTALRGQRPPGDGDPQRAVLVAGAGGVSRRRDGRKPAARARPPAHPPGRPAHPRSRARAAMTSRGRRSGVKDYIASRRCRRTPPGPAPTLTGCGGCSRCWIPVACASPRPVARSWASAMGQCFVRRDADGTLCWWLAGG